MSSEQKIIKPTGNPAVHNKFINSSEEFSAAASIINF
jgi:hypothetical protein